jgi:hypothetical protein
MASMMPNPIAQRLRLLFNAAHPNVPPAPVGAGGVEQVAAGLDPIRRTEHMADEINPAHHAEQVAGGLGGGGNAGGGLGHALLIAALAGGHHGGHGHGGGLAEQFAAQHNPAHLTEEMAAQLGHHPAPTTPGIHYFGPGGSGVAYPGEGGPIGPRGIAYSSPPRHRSALALAFGRAPMSAAVHPFQAV